MTGVALAVAWGVAALLAWTGIAKLAAPRRTAATFRGLGLPAASALAVAVPAAELGTAALLVAVPRVGAVLAGGLLLAFTALLAVKLRGGAEVACGCFGTARAEPLTPAALVRNGLLVAGAVAIAVVAPGAGVPPLEAALVAVGAGAVGGVAVALWDLRARTGRLWDNRLPTGPGALS